MKVISLINQKGGVGKTTSAISIASFLGKEKRVLLIDLDPQGNATSNTGINKRTLKYTVKDLLTDEDKPAKECIVETNKGFDLIGSNLEVADTEINLFSMMDRDRILKEKLEVINSEYDYVIIDCPPTLSLMTLNALISSNLALIPLEPHIFAIEGIESLIKTITKVKKINKELKHKFFITKLDGRIGSFKEMEDSLRNVLKENVYNTQIRIDNKIRTAQNNSQTIYEIKGSKAAEDYMNLVGEINGTFNI